MGHMGCNMKDRVCTVFLYICPTTQLAKLPLGEIE